jgi:hypothetical protein|nr:MAG TPA_asm: Prokaryotic membrane lipoprotein lipid attachment site [Caudoviricetes sp.]
MKKLLIILVISSIISGCKCLGIYNRDSYIESYEIEIQNMDTYEDIDAHDVAMQLSNRIIMDKKLRSTDKAYLIDYIIIMLKSWEYEELPEIEG